MKKPLSLFFFLLIAIPLVSSLQPGDSFTFSVCFNDENGSATKDATDVFGKVLFPNNTVRETIVLEEVDETNLPCVWNGTYVIPRNETVTGVWSIIVNGSVPDDETPSSAIQFEVFPPREPFWQASIMIIILGTSIMLAYLYANLDQSHFYLKFIFLGMSIITAVIGASVMQSIVDVSNLAAGSDLIFLNSLLAISYRIISFTLWFFAAYATVYLLYRVLLAAGALDKLIKKRQEKHEGDNLL